MVASFTADERQEVDEAVLIVAVVAGAGCCRHGVAFSIVGRVLGPLRELRDAARSVSGTHMGRRIEVEGDDELAELGAHVQPYARPAAVAFASQREFIRDVSHELRTPIAVSRGHLELLAEGHLPEEDDRREAIALVTGELDRMSRFVEDLLLLAKADSPDFLQLETVPLDDLAESWCEGAGDRGPELADRPVSPLSIVADRQRLTQAVMNLAHNAVAHTSDDDEIGIGASSTEHEAPIWVRDTGTGIPASEQRRIFSRFSRGCTAAAATRAAASGWRSCGRSPRRTAAGSGHAAGPGRELGSRSCCRSTGAPEQDWVVEVGG